MWGEINTRKAPQALSTAMRDADRSRPSARTGERGLGSKPVITWAASEHSRKSPSGRGTLLTAPPSISHIFLLFYGFLQQSRSGKWLLFYLLLSSDLIAGLPSGFQDVPGLWVSPPADRKSMTSQLSIIPLAGQRIQGGGEIQLRLTCTPLVGPSFKFR